MGERKMLSPAKRDIFVRANLFIAVLSLSAQRVDCNIIKTASPLRTALMLLLIGERCTSTNFLERAAYLSHAN